MLVNQFQRADTGVVEVVELEAGAQPPFTPCRFTRRMSQQALVGDDNQTVGELQAGIQVNLEPSLDLFTGGQLWLDFSGPAAGQYTARVAYPIQRCFFLPVDSRQGIKLSAAVEYAEVTNKESHVSHFSIHAGNRRADSAWS